MQDSVSRTGTPSTPVAIARHPRGWLAWAIRQTLIGVLILSAVMGTWAWLTYKGIDFDQDAKAAVFMPVPDEPTAEKSK